MSQSRKQRRRAGRVTPEVQATHNQSVEAVTKFILTTIRDEFGGPATLNGSVAAMVNLTLEALECGDREGPMMQECAAILELAAMVIRGTAPLSDLVEHTNANMRFSERVARGEEDN